MKSSGAKLSKIFLIQLTGTLFFFLFILTATATATQAQGNINDDLSKPAPTPSSSSPRRPKGGKTTRTKTPVKKPVARRVETASAPESAPAALAPAAAPKPAPATATPTASAVPPPPAQTPSEIFDRFMNLQQTASVTNKDWESVVKQATATLQENPGDKTAKAQLAFAHGELAFNRSDYSNALIQFNAASLALPDSALPFYGIGRVYLNTKQANQAENAFERAIKIDKNFALGYKGLGDALTAQGKTKKADDYYKQAARAGFAGGSSANSATGNAGNSSNAAGGASQAVAPESATERDFKIARDYTAQKRWQMSLDKLTPLAASSPSAEIYLAIGDNYYGMQAWLSAQQAYRKATEANPNLALAYYKLGMVLYETNEFQAAAEAFEKSLILDQSGATINRAQARKMADKASEKMRDMNKDGKKKGFLGIGF